MKIIEFIRQFISLGIAIVPLYHRSKEPMLGAWREFQSRLPTNTEYLNWFPTDWCNYAVICGWQNLVVLDFDNLFHFALWCEWGRGAGLHEVVDRSFKVITAHGMHVYLRTAEPCANDKRISRSGGIDVQSHGKYVVGPGCVHPTGAQYVPVGELRLIEVASVEQVLPLDIFPRVTAETSLYTGAPVHVQATNTEYQSDPLAFSQLDLISKVKSMIRIETLFTGVQRSSTDGRWLKALCPFHKDQHQSAWIDVQRQLAGCQVCGMKPMDVINVYARTRRISESAAVKMLAEEINVWR